MFLEEKEETTMQAVLIISLIIVFVVLLLCVITTNKAYQYQHTIDSLDDHPHFKENERESQKK
jgi:cell division protein FtsL